MYIVTDCRPPTTEISLEQSEYVVDEGIGKLNRALQVCFVSTDLLIGVNLNLKVMNGSAIGKCVNDKLLVHIRIIVYRWIIYFHTLPCN